MRKTKEKEKERSCTQTNKTSKEKDFFSKNPSVFSPIAFRSAAEQTWKCRKPKYL